MNYTHLILLLALTGAGVSCKKKDEPQPPTRAQLLTGKNWQLRTATLSYPGSNEVDLYAQTLLCSRDDFRRFELPNTAIYDEGQTTCSVYNPQTELGVWAFSNKDTKLTITDPKSSTTYTVMEVTATSLSLTLNVPQSTGLDAIETLDFVIIP
jgi:hypothetical protein